MNHYLLHIETATKVCSVAISLNGKEVSLKELDSEQYIHGECLNLFIQEVLREAQINIKDLSAVSISSGPGSYTGLRIGVSSVKGLCYGLKIPLISISTLEAIYFLAMKKHQNKAICAMLDARRMEVYCQIWNAEGSVVKVLSSDILNENSYQDFEPFVCIGDGSTKMKEEWMSRSIQFDTTILPSAKGQITLAYERFLKNDFVDIADFVPNYLKEFQSSSHSK
jgi:tRNA threonylcarbamoyladenosine biosynthesis protein TsaB